MLNPDLVTLTAIATGCAVFVGASKATLNPPALALKNHKGFKPYLEVLVVLVESVLLAGLLLLIGNYFADANTKLGMSATLAIVGAGFGSWAVASGFISLFQPKEDNRK